MEAKERLYLTEDGRVVTEDDPDVRWLWAIPGQKIVDAEKYGVVDGLAARPEPEEAPAPKPPAKKKTKKR